MARLCVEVFQKVFQIPALKLTRPISQSAARWQTDTSEVQDGDDEIEMSVGKQKPKRLLVDPDTSMRYLDSEAYDEAYGSDPVWKHYRRNFKGSRPSKTRKTCIRQGEISTGSPCPICRDEYLVLDMKNVKLLEQFISPYTGEVYDFMKTGLCQKQHKKLLIEVEKARYHGYVEGPVPFRRYDYSQYLDTSSWKKKS